MQKHLSASTTFGELSMLKTLVCVCNPCDSIDTLDTEQKPYFIHCWLCLHGIMISRDKKPKSIVFPAVA